MACRLLNRSGHILRIDVRGGATLQLAPGATSGPLRDELLYENQFLPRWEREGLVVRLPARFEEVLSAEAGVVREPPPAEPKKAPAKKRERAARKRRS